MNFLLMYPQVEKGMPILRCIAQLVRFAAEHCSAKDIAVLLAAVRAPGEAFLAILMHTVPTYG